MERLTEIMAWIAIWMMLSIVCVSTYVFTGGDIDVAAIAVLPVLAAGGTFAIYRFLCSITDNAQEDS
jgi:hypothetical protein